MATKKGKKAAMEAAPVPPFYPISDESRARYRHQSLLQDYQELLKESEAKRKQLERAKQKKLQLLAEVKFLRRKYKSLTRNPSGKMPYKLKKRPPSMLLHFIHGSQPSMTTSTQSETSMKHNTHIGKEASIPSTSGGIDLNQVSLPNGDEMEEFQVNWEPLKIDNSKKRLVEGEALPNDLKLSICRDVGSGPSRAGKRKITWQDQVVLKV